MVLFFLPGGKEISKNIFYDGFACGLFVPDRRLRRFTFVSGDNFYY
jgi:hypothetical protein